MEPSLPPHLRKSDERDRGLSAQMWGLWGAMNWFLPLLLIASRFIFPDEGGWETLLLVFSVPFSVPLCGLLGWIPRKILVRRGHRVAPWYLNVVVLIHWVGAALCLWGMLGVGDSGPVGSPLTAFWGISEDASLILSVAGGGAVVLAWIAEIVMACLQPRQQSH